MKVWTGKVISTKGKKTAVVEVERLFAHPFYGKRIKRAKRYPVHDEIEVKEGEIVRFVETRPLSKTKRWKIVEIISDSKKKRVTSKRGNKLPRKKR